MAEYNSTSNKEYWLHQDSEQAVSYLENYHSKWGLWNTSPIRQAWVRNFIAYHSAVITPSAWDTSMVFEGIQGELLKFFTPVARSYMRQLVTLITKQRLSFQAMAQSCGEEIIQDVKLANALLDQIVDKQRLNLKAENLVEYALILGAGFLKTCWRTDHGEKLDIMDEKIIYKGEIDISVVSVFDCFYDINVPTWEQLDWVEVRTIKNRWDLIAQHPELKDKLLSLPSWSEIRGPNYWFDRAFVNEDTVCIYEMYAKPTPSLPKGRMVIYGDSNCVIYDGINAYGDIPIEPMIPEPVQGTGLGYPKFTNILASNEMLDTTLSSIATNQAQFGVQGILKPRGANINVKDFNGMRVIDYTPMSIPGGGKPEPLQLTASPPESFKFLDILMNNIGSMSDVQPILRGDSTGATSGTMVATLSANAIEFITSISKSYHICMENTLAKCVSYYKKFTLIPKKITVNGKNNQISQREFVGKNLDNINGVKLIISNPLMQTIAGRMEIAQQLQQMPDNMKYDYISLLEGRPLSEITDKYLSQADLVWSENEELKDGEPVIALATDDHAYHIKMHSQILNDPKIRKNSSIIELVLAHLQEHIELAKTTDPMLQAMVKGQEVPPEMMAQQQPMGMPPEGPMEQIQPEQGAEIAGKPANPAQDLLGRSM